METKIEQIGGEWKVTFTHGVQTFTLDYTGTKQECQWYKDRLDECFARALGNTFEREKANELLPHVSGMLPDEDNVKLKDNGFGALENALKKVKECKHKHAAITQQGWKCTECGKLVG